MGEDIKYLKHNVELEKFFILGSKQIENAYCCCTGSKNGLYWTMPGHNKRLTQPFVYCLFSILYFVYFNLLYCVFLI